MAIMSITDFFDSLHARFFGYRYLALDNEFGDSKANAHFRGGIYVGTFCGT